MRSLQDTLKATFEGRLMSVEEELTSEQIKCREVIRVRCEPIETEVKALRAAESMMKHRLQAAQADALKNKD